MPNGVKTVTKTAADYFRENAMVYTERDLQEALATQERELLEWVRTEVEEMKYQQPLLGTPVHTEELVFAVNNTLDDIKAKLLQRRELGEREL